MKTKTRLRWVLSAVMMTLGLLHFVVAPSFARTVPAWLPAPFLLVYVSGLAEIAGAIGLQVPRLRRAAGWGLVALYIAVFPANVNMAIHHISPSGIAFPTWALWGRLPFQAVFIAWAYWFTKD